jgi:hypothetical protein
VIEILLQAERALAMGLTDQAERLYVQAVAADPRNSIAVVGLARVALERADGREAYRLAREALAIDPENVAAAGLASRLEEVHAARGIPLNAEEESPDPAGEPAAHASPSTPAPAVSPSPPVDRSLVDRLLRRNRP